MKKAKKSLIFDVFYTNYQEYVWQNLLFWIHFEASLKLQLVKDEVCRLANTFLGSFIISNALKFRQIPRFGAFNFFISWITADGNVESTDSAFKYSLYFYSPKTMQKRHTWLFAEELERVTIFCPKSTPPPTFYADVDQRL